MKLVNRYHLWASLECQHFSKAEAVLKFSAEEDGMWVQWQDYARLKEEVERFKFILEEERQITRQDWAGLRCEHDRVKRALEQAEAEVERLTNCKSEADRLKAEVERLEPELEQRCRELNLSLGQQAVQLRQIGELKTQLEHIDLLKSVVEKFFNSADLKNPLDTQSHCAITEKLKQLPDCILDFTEEQVRDNPAWALAVFRHKVKEMQYKRVHDLNAIGGEQEENARLKAEVEALMTTPTSRLLRAEREENARLKAEVERLRKAGDDLEFLVCFNYEGDIKGDKHCMGILNAWNAAKEGKPSV